MCHTSARFHAIILITGILTDTGRSKNFQKRKKFGRKIRIQHRPDRQDSWKKKCVLMKKLSKLFLQHLPVPLWHSFEVVIIMGLYVENISRFPLNL